MRRSLSVLKLCWLPVLSLVCSGAVNAADYRCSFGSAIRSVAVHQDAVSGQGSCEVVYHKPPAAPGILWTAQSDVAFCEDRAKELVSTLTRGGWSCHELPGVSADDAMQALIQVQRAEQEQTLALAELSLGPGPEPARDVVPQLKPALRPDDAMQALIAVQRADREQAVSLAELRLGPEPLPDVMPQLKPALGLEAIAAPPPEEVGRAAEPVAVAAALANEPWTPGKVPEGYSQVGIQHAALEEPDVDPPYEVDDIRSRPSRAVAAGKQVRSLLEMRRDKVVVQQWDFSCGAAALATILNYQHGDPVTEREVAIGLIDRKEYLENPDLVRMRLGFSLLDLKRYVDERGYEGIGYGDLTLKDLIERAPIMVPVDFNGYNHFVVFRGMMRDRVLLADPAYGNRTMTVQHFEDGWLDYPEFGKVGFVVARVDGLAPPNELAPLPDDFVMVN
jgi:predicted double-glycine peptidase